MLSESQNERGDEAASAISMMTAVASNLSPELVKRAQEELQEKPEWRSRDIEALRQMVIGDTDLCCPLDDAFLLRFLRARKFDYDRAFDLLRRYYLIRMNNVELYTNFRPSAVMHVFRENIQIMLPDRDQDGRRVFVFCLGRWKPEDSSLEDIFRANQMCLEKVIEEEETQINGIVSIIDMRNIGINQAKHLRPAYAKKVISLVQDCFPARFKGFHYVFENALLDMILLMVRPFLSEKIRNRIYCHGWDLNSLHQHICPEILPEEYGGTGPPLDNSAFVQSLLECDDVFAKNASCGYQTIRQQDDKKVEAFEGIVGNYYRKLCVD